MLSARTLRANVNEERELIAMARSVPFDDRINYHTEVSALKPALLADYLHSVGSNLYQSVMDRSVEEVGTDMQIVRGPSEYRKPVNVGLMFFNDNPEVFFPCARIEVVDKPDPTGRGMTEKIFRGPLDKQLRDALAYIRNYIIKEKITKVADDELAVRVFNWPYAAVEEALSNAVYHKSYQINEPIIVMITPDKMEITSVPGPDRSITDESLGKRVLVSRRYRNRRIGDYLKELNIVEGRNTGVPTILEAMRNNGSGLPSFETDAERSYFVTVLPVHPFFMSTEVVNVADEKVETKKEAKRKEKDLKLLILDILEKEGYLSTNELALVLGYKKVTVAVRVAVRELIESGKIVYMYPDKPNSRNQKLCFCDK